MDCRYRHTDSATTLDLQTRLIAEIGHSTERPLGTALVVDLHRAAMAGTGMRSTFRRGPQAAVVGGSPHYVCPPASQLSHLLEGFCTALQAALVSWDAHHAAALALWSLCYLHLFSDGNGRTARCLAFAVLARTGAATVSVSCLHRFHTYYRTRAVRRHYFETLQATTDVLSSIADPLDFPEDAFAPLASLISEATEWAGNRLAAAC